MAEENENQELIDENRVYPDEDRKKSLALFQAGLGTISKTAYNTGILS